jgi:hypothetical protein
VTFRSSGDELLYIADTAVHPIHLRRPDWHLAVDVDPRDSIASRRCLLEEASDAKALVQAYHFPFPGLGHVVKKGNAWDWIPLDTEA